MGTAMAVEVAVTRHVWDPDSYVPIARALLPSRRGQTAPAPTSTVLVALLTPTSRVMQRENARISGALGKAPFDAGLHEQAAVLLGTLALREQAGRFHDTRPALARTAAHLAVARALTSEKRSATGSVAEALLLILGGRPQDGVSQLSGVPADWQTALEITAPATGGNTLRPRTTRPCWSASPSFVPWPPM
jgi:hypothetical protein